MANPKRRHTRTRRDLRRTHWKLTLPSLAVCPKCKAPVMPHRVCKECGFYGDELVIVKKEKKSKGTAEGTTQAGS